MLLQLQWLELHAASALSSSSWVRSTARFLSNFCTKTIQVQTQHCPNTTIYHQASINTCMFFHTHCNSNTCSKMAFTREVIQPISFKENQEIPSFLSLQIIWATEHYEDVSSFRLPLNLQLSNSYKIWKDSSWASHLHRSAFPRESASQICPP